MLYNTILAHPKLIIDRVGSLVKQGDIALGGICPSVLSMINSLEYIRELRTGDD